MATLKQKIYKILLSHPKTRDSDKELVWEVWNQYEILTLDYECGDLSITEEDFMKAPDYKSIERCRRALQRTDLISGKKLIQPTEEIKQTRVKLSKSKGFEYQEGVVPPSGKFVYNPVTQTYEIQSMYLCLSEM
jgi:hypothetical protein